MLKGWKTIIFNAASAVVMVAGVVLQYVGELGLTDAQAAMAGVAATLVVNFGNMYLRWVTTTAVGQKS